MSPENKQPETSETEKVLLEALADQAPHFTGTPEEQLSTESDEAFWRANRNLLKAVRDNEAANASDDPTDKQM